MKQGTPSTASVTTEEVINDPRLRAAYLAGRRAGWIKRHELVRAERAGEIEPLSDDAGCCPPPRTTASDVRDLIDLVTGV